MPADTRSDAGPVTEADTFYHDAFWSFLLDRGLVGLAWADSDLTVQGTVGSLASWISPGQHIPSELAPLLGLEDELNELMDDFRPSLVVPNVGIHSADGPAEKTSLEVFWSDPQKRFVVVLHRLGGQPEFEADLARQLRARRLAEGNLAATQREMQETQGLLEIIAERAPVGLAVLDDQMRYRFVTQRWISMLDYEGQPVIGSGHAKLTSAAGRALDDSLVEALGGRDVSGSAARLDGEHQGPLRGTVWQHSAWHDQRGSIGGVVASLTSVSELAEENARLRARVEDLGQANAHLESFASMLAHDVRGPVSLARRKLMEGATDADESTMAEIDSALDRVLQIADGLLEYAAASGQPGPVHSVDVGALARRIAEDSIAGTNMRLEIAGRWPVMATAVAPLDLVLRNLVENAVRHHDRDQGTLRLGARAEDAHLIVEITDDGPGIPRDRHEAIFSPLVTLAGGSGQSSGGLGLSFVQRAAKSVGGRIEVDSDPSLRRGSTFRVYWPYPAR